MSNYNSYQSSDEDLGIKDQPIEIQEQYYEFIESVPFIRSLISKDRPRAKDLPRDEEGKIIIDLTKPHILEDMDYFRPAMLYYKEHGVYTKLRPNNNPNSDYYKWLSEEVRRCRYGYVRESDGEWIPGDLYYFWNYAPMQITEKKKGSNMALRKMAFPDVWEGHYLKFHALNQARQNGTHYIELASRSRGKSYCAAAMLAKRFILGEFDDVKKGVTCYATAYEKKYLVAGDQTLDKFQYNIDFMAENMPQLPHKRISDTLNNMTWTMGYKKIDTGVRAGTGNSVVGITAKDDEAKLRGTRGVLYIMEEAGNFPRLDKLWMNLRPSVEFGESVFGMLVAYGTAGDTDSDFESMQKMMYHPDGYNILSLPNVYDKAGQGGPRFGFFFPGYLNQGGCYDENGNSDVTLALLTILKSRYKTKYGTSDHVAVAKAIAEVPITPQEAIMRSSFSMFPVASLTERLHQLDQNPKEYDDVYVGTLRMVKDSVEFLPSADIPIRIYPTDDNKEKGALEIFQMPEKGSDGKIDPDRYILGHDPVDSDVAQTMSLTSTFVLDLWTDKIVAEYTGRNDYADDNFEMVRLMCLFYNGRCLYESNKKGIFAYFQKMNSLYLLADTPEYLRDKQIIKFTGQGNASKGVNATVAVNNYANERIRDWLLKPVIVNNGEDNEYTTNNLYFIRNRALLQELIAFNPIANFDRVRALGMVMLYREERMIMYGGDFSGRQTRKNIMQDDPFLSRNYKNNDRSGFNLRFPYRKNKLSIGNDM